MSKRSASANAIGTYSANKIRRTHSACADWGLRTNDPVAEKKRGEDTHEDEDEDETDTDYLAAVLHKSNLYNDPVVWNVLRERATRLWFETHPKVYPTKDKRVHDCASEDAACTQYHATVTLYGTPPFTYVRIQDPAHTHVCIAKPGTTTITKTRFCRQPQAAHDPASICVEHHAAYFCSTTGALHLCEEHCQEAQAKSGGLHTDGQFVCPISRTALRSAGQVFVSSKYWRAGQKSEQESQADRMERIKDMAEAFGERTRKSTTVARRLKRIELQSYIQKTRSMRREMEKFPPLDEWTRDLCFLETFDAVQEHLNASLNDDMLDTFRIADRYCRIVRAAVYHLLCPQRHAVEEELQNNSVRTSLAHVNAHISRYKNTGGCGTSLVNIVQLFNTRRHASYFIRSPTLDSEQRQAIVEAYSSRVINLWCLLRTYTSAAKHIPEAFLISDFTYGALMVLANGIIDDQHEARVILGATTEILMHLPTNAATVPSFSREDAIQIRNNITFAIRNALHNEALEPAVFDEVHTFPESIYYPVSKAKRAPMQIKLEVLQARATAAAAQVTAAPIIKRIE